MCSCDSQAGERGNHYTVKHKCLLEDLQFQRPLPECQDLFWWCGTSQEISRKSDYLMEAVGTASSLGFLRPGDAQERRASAVAGVNA